MTTSADQDTRLLHGRTYSNAIETTYNTPLVKLNRVAPEGATVLVKLEFFNPMSSVKDRIGRAMIEAAEEAGTIDKNTHIIEPTSGNTGIALAFVCAAKGYKLTLTMPESMSLERRALLRALGAELVLTPAANGMKGAIAKAAEMVTTTDNAWMPQQFENPANPEVHYRTTGAEIWNDTNGKADMIVAGVGTGGTVTGVTRYFRDKGKSDFTAITVEPTDSPVIKQTLEKQEVKPGPHKIQGIGAGFVPKNLDISVVSDSVVVSNDEAFEWARKVASQEAIFGGISTGANICAACQVAARPENKGKTIVTIAPSFGERYLSTPLFEGLTG
ncbi:cysteine synthase A [Phycisphaerales bacterium AB-hyl4]|uniref:cysteine synthase n=1 Tax=Natronomicrosphaera hydrolytica TaxID=3242702 RepID=A0ABV4U240_9BACT